MDSGGYAYRAPPESPPFNDPGGKHFRLTMALNSGAASTVLVQLYRTSGALLYDFGTKTVSSSTLNTFVYESYLPVSGEAAQLRISNQGPGSVRLTQVVSVD